MGVPPENNLSENLSEKWPIVASGFALRRSWSVGLVGMAGESASHSAHLLLPICVLRLVESAHGEAPEIFHDERDARGAHQVQTETKAVWRSQL